MNKKVPPLQKLFLGFRCDILLSIPTQKKYNLVYRNYSYSNTTDATSITLIIYISLFPNKIKDEL